MAFSATDFGYNVPGLLGAQALGTTVQTATLLTTQATVFTEVASGGLALLPSVTASMIMLLVFNEGSNVLTVMAQSGGTIDLQLEGNGTAIAPGGMSFFFCFDPTLSPGINWYSSSGLGGSGGGGDSGAGVEAAQALNLASQAQTQAQSAQVSAQNASVSAIQANNTANAASTAATSASSAASTALTTAQQAQETANEALSASSVGSPIPNLTTLANISGQTAVATPITLTALMDAAVSNVAGSIVYRGVSGWTALQPGIAGQVLVSGGNGYGLSWASLPSQVTPTAPGAATFTIGTATSTTIPVTITAPTSGGTVSSYVLMVSVNSNMANAATYSTQSLTTNITGLVANTEYYITLTPYNGYEAGPTTSAQSVTTASTTVTPPPAVSASGTVVLAGTTPTATTGFIYDALGNTWTVPGAQVVVNGSADGTTSNVAEIEYFNSYIYYETTGGVWYYKQTPGASWVQTTAPATVTITGLSLSPNTGAPNASVGTVVGTLTPAATGTLTGVSYVISSISGGPGDEFSQGFSSQYGDGSDQFSTQFSTQFDDNSIFQISGNTLVYASAAVPAGTYNLSIQVLATNATNSTAAFTIAVTISSTIAPSANYAIVTTVGPNIVDARGNSWTITSGAQMAINGTTITATSGVTALAYVNSVVWQFSKGLWYSVSTVSGTTVTFATGTATSPLVASADETTVTTAGPTIVDASGYIWTITNTGVMALNGQPLSNTADVVEIAYISGVIWQENSTGNWYSVTTVVSVYPPSVTFSTAQTSPYPTIEGISLSSLSVVAGAASGTIVGVITTTMSQGAFTGTLALTGPNASLFKIVGDYLEVA